MFLYLLLGNFVTNIYILAGDSSIYSYISLLQFILNLIYRVATGQMKEVDDVRESEVEERIQNIKNNKICQNTVNNSKYVHLLKLPLQFI